MSSMKEMVAREAIAMSPTGGVAGAVICGVELSTIVLGLTLLYTVLQILFLIQRWRKFNAANKSTGSGDRPSPAPRGWADNDE